MATHLDLEEQEQLDALKHFWNQWGNLITWVLIAVLGAYAAWNGWQYWERRQAGLASVLYDEVDRAAQAGDVARVERALADMKDKYGGTTYAGLLSAKVLAEKGKPAEAKAALAAMTDKAPNDGLRAVARLRLASVQIGEKAYDDALKTLSGSFPAPYTALVADRRGDVLLLQGQREQAAAEFGKAYQGLTAESGDYRRLVGMKLNALGIDPDAGAKAGAAS